MRLFYQKPQVRENSNVNKALTEGITVIRERGDTVCQFNTA